MKKLILAVALASSCMAQDKPAGPTKADWALLIAHASVRTLDTYSTTYVIDSGGHEVHLPNVIATHPAAMAAYSAGCVAADWYASRWLVRHHHRKLAYLLPVADIAVDAPDAIGNMFLKFPKKPFGSAPIPPGRLQ